MVKVPTRCYRDKVPRGTSRVFLRVRRRSWAPWGRTTQSWLVSLALVAAGLAAALARVVPPASATVPALGEVVAPSGFAGEVVARLDLMTGMPIEPVPAGTTFADLQDDVAAVATAPTGTYVDPRTGNPWDLATLLERASGLRDWLPESASTSAVESQIRAVLGYMGWRLAAYPVLQGVSAQATDPVAAAGCTTDSSGKYVAPPKLLSQWQSLFSKAEAGPWTSGGGYLGAQAGASGAGATVQVGRGVINALLPLGSQAGSGMPSPSSSPLWQSGLPVPGVAVDGALVVLEIDAFGTGGSQPGVTSGGAPWDTGAGEITITGGPGVANPSFVPGGGYAGPQPTHFGSFFPDRIPGISTGYVVLKVPTSFLFQSGGNPLHPVFKPAALIQVQAQEPPPGWLSGRELGITCEDNKEWTVADVSNVDRPTDLSGDPVIYHEAFGPLVAECSTKPAATLSPLALEFSTHRYEQWTEPQTITITNTGGQCSVLHISSNRFASSSRYLYFGTAPANAQHTCAGRALRPGKSCSVDVSFFAEVLPGSATGSLTVTDNAGVQTATLSGVAKNFSIAPSRPFKVKFTPSEKDDFNDASDIHGVYGAVLIVMTALAPELVIPLACLAGTEALAVVVDARYGRDPVGMHYQSVALPRLAALPALPRSLGTLSPPVAALLANLEKMKATSSALMTSIDRAQGAAVAHDTSAERAQLQAAKSYAEEAADLQAAQPALEADVLAAIKRTGAPLSFSAADVKSAVEQVAQKGLPTAVRAILTEAGLDASQIANLARSASTVHGTLALSTAFFARVWASDRQVASDLRGFAALQP